MQFRINSEFLQKERNQRAWTQQHLAEASDLSLRTIQRIETNGTGSQDSIQAIASALELSTTDLVLLKEQKSLLQQNTSQGWMFKTDKLKIVTSSLLLITLIIFLGSLVLHSSKLMAESSFSFIGNVVIDNDDGHVFDVQVPFNSIYEIELTTEYKLLIVTPKAGGEWDTTESRLLHRTGLSEYEILHSADIIGPVTKTRAFTYLVCGTETIFTNNTKKMFKMSCPL